MSERIAACSPRCAAATAARPHAARPDERRSAGLMSIRELSRVPCTKRTNAGGPRVRWPSRLCTGHCAQGTRRRSRAGPNRGRGRIGEAPGQGDIRAPQLMQRSGGVDCCRATIVATESETIEVHGSAYLVWKNSQVAGYRKMFGCSPHFRARSRYLPHFSPSTRRALTRPRGMDCATAGTRSRSHAPEARRPATEARGHSPRKAGVTAHPRSVDFWHAAPH